MKTLFIIVSLCFFGVLSSAFGKLEWNQRQVIYSPDVSTFEGKLCRFNTLVTYDSTVKYDNNDCYLWEIDGYLDGGDVATDKEEFTKQLSLIDDKQIDQQGEAFHVSLGPCRDIDVFESSKEVSTLIAKMNEILKENGMVVSSDSDDEILGTVELAFDRTMDSVGKIERLIGILNEKFDFQVSKETKHRILEDARSIIESARLRE